MTSDEEYQLELVQAERDDALRQVETLRAGLNALGDLRQFELQDAAAELKRVTEQLADANTASDLNCHGWKECQAELARVTAERDAALQCERTLAAHQNSILEALHKTKAELATLREQLEAVSEVGSQVSAEARELESARVKELAESGR